MKRLIFLAFVGIILLSIATLGYKIVRGNAEKDATALRIRILPELRFTQENGAPITNTDFPPDKALVIVHFLPDCHFCQGEAKEFSAHPELLADAHVLFVSAAAITQIREFTAAYALRNLPSVTIAADSLKTFGQTFGTASVPTTFVYGKAVSGKRLLLKQFHGETSAEAIKKALSHSADSPSSKSARR